MNKTAKVGAAVAGGYLMGRSKKAKLAFALGTWMMGKRLSLDAGKLAREGLSALTSSEDLARLTGEVRQELLGAGRAAAMAMFTERVEKLADSLHQRTAAMTGTEEPPEQDGEEGEEQDGEQDEEQDEEQDGEPQDENGEQDGDDKEPDTPRLRKRPAERQGTERPHRPAGRVRSQSSTQDDRRSAVRAGSKRHPAASEDPPPPLRSRSDANRRTAAKAARSRS